MTAEDKTARRPWPFEKHIPEEARKHARAAREEMHKSMEALFPPGFIEHRRAARKEMLKAVRAMLDATLERMEAREKKA